MKKEKLTAVLSALLNAQNYVNGEMEAICNVDAMDEAKDIFEELDDAIVNVRKMLEEQDVDEYKRTWVGYQVKTKDDEFITPYTDKDVFRNLDDAENFIRSRSNSIFLSHVDKDDMVVVSRWLENDDEEKRNFVFHGKKNRSFEKNEMVWDEEKNQWATVRTDAIVSRESDLIPVWGDKGGYTAKAEDIYQVEDGKVCPRCGNPLCIEHHDHIDYPYYCPDCQENFYNVELL